MIRKFYSSFIMTMIIALLPLAATSATKVSITQALENCKSLGNKIQGAPIQSKLKQETSLIGMAYLNYLYQNDLNNPHYCQSMLLMNSQVPKNTNNPYEHLFDAGMGEKTLTVLENIQLSFDYSIARSKPPAEKMQASIDKIQQVLK